MGAIILDGAKIGSDCIIGAGSLVTKNTIIPDGSLVMGSPAKIKRNLTWEEKIGILENSKEYVCVAEEMWKQECCKQINIARCMWLHLAIMKLLIFFIYKFFIVYTHI